MLPAGAQSAIPAEPINAAPDVVLLGKVFGIAKTLRPDRHTLLDSFDAENLISAYGEFVTSDQIPLRPERVRVLAG